MADGRKVKLGVVSMTAGVNALAAESDRVSSRLLDCLRRHASGDWGELDAEDKAANEAALVHGSRLLSAYKLDESKPYEGDNRLWIITEASRTHTTLLLPDEY